MNFLSLIVLIGFISTYECATDCYTCTSCPEIFNNSTATAVPCEFGSDTCMKSTIRYPGGAIIAKACVPGSSCSPTSVNIIGYGFWINCCTDNNCNSALNTLPHIYAIIASIILSVLN